MGIKVPNATMTYPRITAELLAQEELPGLESRSRNHLDTFLVRDRACWLVSEREGSVVVGRVASDPDRVLAERRSWPVPRPGQNQGFVSPLPDAGLATVDRGLVTVYGQDGSPRWTYEFQPWPDEDTAGGACVPVGTAGRLLVTTTGSIGDDGLLGADVCVCLDLADGRPVAEAELPSATAGYVFQQSLTDPAQIFLDALMGDTCFSLELSLEDDAVHVRPVGDDDEPFAGVSLRGAVLKLDVGGQWLTRCVTGQEDTFVEAEDVLPQGLRFVGHRPGLLDEGRVLAAAAAEQGSDANRHLILDGHTLQPVAEVDYPGTTCYDPLALGDGTWLTTEEDVVRRWRVTGAE
ncbi:hypothetical protein ABZ636_33760 [Streptomyces sp. NPDC007251]